MLRYVEQAIEARLDPLRVIAALANCGRFGEYVVYEREGRWTFAGGALGTVTMTTHEVRCAGEALGDCVLPLSASPGAALLRALDRVDVDDWNVYGWLGFDFAGILPGMCPPDVEPPEEALAHLIVPRVEVHVDGSGAQVRAADRGELQLVRDMVSRPVETPAYRPQPVDVDAGSAVYRKRVAQAVNEIHSGQYQKVVLSRSVEIPFSVDMVGTYLLGRASNTPERSFLLDLGGTQSAGFSPEMVVTVDSAGAVSTAPLAGTRALGRGPDVDALARDELETDCKEVFEHAVSVRTAQRELTSVCRTESVGVSDFMEVRERGSVQHLGSTVRGVLADTRTAWDALEALFPAVTASGIPKRQALESIARLEESHRGLYAGSVLTASANGSLEAALVLRAAYQQGGRAWLRAGAGVVADSTPERELEETCEKLGSVAPFMVPGKSDGSSAALAPEQPAEVDTADRSGGHADR